jgi:hypothetical protein
MSVTIVLPVTIVHTCSCGLTYTTEQWRRLKLLGHQDDDGKRLEMRNCSCGSTRSIVVDARGNPCLRPSLI